ncbi:hypothetical protein PV325_008687 [Microctonus aethiopoides]|nr:hypothetical protein PV325_008687 [Microctonus aethiopoides]
MFLRKPMWMVFFIYGGIPPISSCAQEMSQSTRRVKDTYRDSLDDVTVTSTYSVAYPPWSCGRGKGSEGSSLVRKSE